jgi:hypothetical protein
MYRWIWDRMPFGVPGKLAGMAMLLVGVVGLLWFVIFPAADPLLPFNNVQVTAPHGSPTDYGTVVPTPAVRPSEPAGSSTAGSAPPSPTATSLPS